MKSTTKKLISLLLSLVTVIGVITLIPEGGLVMKVNAATVITSAQIEKAIRLVKSRYDEDARYACQGRVWFSFIDTFHPEFESLPSGDKYPEEFKIHIQLQKSQWINQ